MDTMKRIIVRIGISVGTLVILASVVYIVYANVTLSNRVAAAYDSTYQESYNNSHSDGYQVGYEEQYHIGFDNGYEDGIGEGQKRGYEEGYSSGEAKGQERGYEEGYASGIIFGQERRYKEEYEKGVTAGRNDGLASQVDLRDPSYAEVMAFLIRDKTNLRAYDIDRYNCIHYCADVNNNAEAEGVRCAFVVLEYIEEIADHTIIAFNTTDRGLVYFEPQSDEVANPVVGKRWYQCIVPEPGYYYSPPPYNDTIKSIEVIW